jgi:hypothetical protein
MLAGVILLSDGATTPGIDPAAATAAARRRRACRCTLSASARSGLPAERRAWPTCSSPRGSFPATGSP